MDTWNVLWEKESSGQMDQMGWPHLSATIAGLDVQPCSQSSPLSQMGQLTDHQSRALFRWVRQDMPWRALLSVRQVRWVRQKLQEALALLSTSVAWGDPWDMSDGLADWPWKQNKGQIFAKNVPWRALPLVGWVRPGTILSQNDNNDSSWV